MGISMAGGKGLDGWRCDLDDGRINEINGPVFL
jgi:hypothetical protein